MRASVVLMLLVSIASAAPAKKPAARTDAAARLIGTWAIDPNDKAGIAAFGRCVMTFKPNGELLYVVPEGGMLLTYRVEGDKDGRRSRYLRQ